jgi:hypothetical protein
MGRSAYERLLNPGPWANLESKLEEARVWLVTVRIWNKGEADWGQVNLKLPSAIEENNIVEMKNLQCEDSDTFGTVALSPNKEIELTFERDSKIDVESTNTEAKGA